MQLTIFSLRNSEIGNLADTVEINENIIRFEILKKRDG